MQQNLKTVCAVIAIIALILTGCVQTDAAPTTESSTVPEPATQTKPETPNQTDAFTEPRFPESPGVMDTAQMKQVRLPGYSAGWVSMFQDRFGAYALVDSEGSLANVLHNLEQMGKEIDSPEGYDATFFGEHYLVLIPMQSASGSVRYKGNVCLEGETILVSLKAEMPEVGTADMADWLLLVTLPRAKFPEGSAISISSGQNGGGMDNFYDK